MCLLLTIMFLGDDFQLENGLGDDFQLENGLLEDDFQLENGLDRVSAVESFYFYCKV